MRAFSRGAAFLLACSFPLLAAGRMGPPSARTRAEWPDAFVPGKVAVVEYCGESCYAFAGEAEDFFPGEGLETEAELHEEAVLDAKTHFYEVLSGGDPARVIGLSGAFVAYRWAEGPMRYIVCMVPVSAVTVSPPVAEDAAPTTETVLPEEEPKTDGGNSLPLSSPPQTNPCETNTP